MVEVMRFGCGWQRWAAYAMALLMSSVTQAVRAGGEDPYPEFVAEYLIKVNGVKVGEAKFRLSHQDAGQYLYESDARKRGVARLLGSAKATESSRWRFVEGDIQVVEYQSVNPEGDDDDNAHLLFDWSSREVENVGAGEHWRIPMPAHTLDPMVMQLAILLDLRDGRKRFEYPVATRGRIKDYRFALVGEDSIELPFGEYQALKVERTDDERDKSWIWSAPELEYFPVRFLKQKASGLKTEILLQKVTFTPHEAAGSDS